MKQIFAILTVILTATCLAPAGEKMSDAEIKQKVIGYWTFGHHGWHIAADGIAYICPGTNKNTWSVKDGMFYWADNVPHTILTLTDKKFVYREPASSTGTATLIRGTKEQFEPCGGSQ
jgi:hypothetical protein